MTDNLLAALRAFTALDVNDVLQFLRIVVPLQGRIKCQIRLAVRAEAIRAIIADRGHVPTCLEDWRNIAAELLRRRPDLAKKRNGEPIKPRSLRKSYRHFLETAFKASV